MQISKAVITAAGRGARQYPASDTVQKVMLPPVHYESVVEGILATWDQGRRHRHSLVKRLAGYLRKRCKAWRAWESEARMTGLEPATSGVTGRCSNQLSYIPNPAWWLRN